MQKVKQIMSAPVSKHGQITNSHCIYKITSSYGNTVNFRVPADVIESGQVDLTLEEWRQLLAKVQQAPGAMVNIEL
ncbi:hypothetical protein [Sporomusa sp. GT1]|uniref:hypothetical protein n=1 Tax=Sporomusa sp. GT1 TaxID=1534747 RepID=UPI001CB7C565|nr:hypothetical protein [Sporomusa sp. GT1]